MSYTALLQPLKIGAHTMKNRFVVPPLTRVRADDDHVPTDVMAQYYAERSGFGLIIAEATMIKEGYSTFCREPGIYGPAQVAGWRTVTDAVHARGGLIYLQLHHGGRATTPENVSNGVVYSSTAQGILKHRQREFFNTAGVPQHFPSKVHALTREEIQEHVQLFATAAKNAIEAGFDGVQVHGANGYLIDQFIKDSCNTRTDEYGGAVENRCRFLFEVMDAVVAAVGRERTALRISPLNVFNEASDSHPEATTKYICEELSKRQIAFLDVLRRDIFSGEGGADLWARQYYKGVLFTGCGFTVEEAEGVVSAKGADAVCFGALSIANPDLVARAQQGAALNQPIPQLYYTKGAKGYTDYPLVA